MRGRLPNIVALNDTFCDTHLNGESITVPGIRESVIRHGELKPRDRTAVATGR